MQRRRDGGGVGGGREGSLIRIRSRSWYSG